ncbi:MAG: hypothetical protein IPM48_10430 [Saprospiraceae bacterium]|nr:hypothetical protein [Saprospiraceae bacterium]
MQYHIHANKWLMGAIPLKTLVSGFLVSGADQTLYLRFILMIYLVLCIGCTLCLGLIFRILPAHYRMPNIIAVNYLICAILSWFGQPQISSPHGLGTWFFGIWMGILFFAGFNFYSASVRENGLGVSTVFQKISIVLTVIVALFVGENPSSLQWLGIILSVPAIYWLTRSDHSKDKTAENKSSRFLLLAAVFLVSSMIEISLILAHHSHLSLTEGSMGLTKLIFTGAALVSIVVLLRNQGYSSIRLTEIGAGIVLGLPNFFSIYFINLSMMEGMQGSQLFPILNCAVLSLSVLIGYAVFKEKLLKIQIWGLMVAMVAILLLSIFNPS